jgi:phosphoglycerol transferase MdoB-like AlkP superfamily enzyme
MGGLKTMASLACRWRALSSAWRRRSIQLLGPYAPILSFFLLGVCALGLSRIGLMIWQWPRVVATDAVASMLLQGLRSDLITLGLLSAPVVIVVPILLALRRLQVWTRLAGAWLAIALILIALMEFATPQFLAEYDARPNRLFIEYLVYPREVFAMLWEGYRLTLCATAIAIAALSWLAIRGFSRYAAEMQPWPASRVMLIWPCVVIILFVMIRSSFQHRPANLSSFAFCDDAMVNSLVANSAYTVFSAAYGLKNEERSSEIYGALPAAEMIQRVRAAMSVPAADFVSEELPTLRRQDATVRREQPLNLVIVLEESLGAGFVERLGGRPIASNLSRLADEGIWFDRLYATGTRSVRGIEAVIAGFPPTPARSVVKLSKSQQGFFTLATLLRSEGYHNEFVYGGESHFDNMRGFFLGNGFQAVVDRNDYAAPKFVGSGGVSDEDLFDMAHQRIQSLHAAGEPFFLLAFSSSNHTPFEYPDGRIEPVDAEKQTVDNAVRYADYALGQFIDRARRSDYWANTLFLIVADHDTRVYGDALVPIDKFHIPGVIVGADVAPRRIESVASQIDLAPTVLSLMGIDSEHPLPGRDLTRTLPEFGQPSSGVQPRAMMQFDQYFAWLQDDIVTVLIPESEPRQFSYDRRTHKLDPLSSLNAEAARNALAHVLMPAWLYREQRYRMRP